jgi:V/A-type H+/Na+-transporting ATPase subunit A
VDVSHRTNATSAGRVVRVNGPLLGVAGITGALAVLDLVEVGDERLLGEVVALSGDQATVQVYEYTGGVGPGAAVVGHRRPLSATLGPWLLGGVFDGLLRPLLDGPDWLTPGALGTVAGHWFVEPRARIGEVVSAGDALADATDDHGAVHEVPVPAGLAGAVSWLAPPGPRAPEDPVATIDGTTVGIAEQWPVRLPRPHGGRLDTAVPLVTGQRVIDLLEPVAKGSTTAVLGGFGTGKTLLLQQIAKWCDADVVVYVGCGERGNELADVMDELRSLDDPRTGRALWERTVIIANTSNMPIMAREASVYTGMTVAEYFRDQGRDVALIADSTSRWAEALREFASRNSELPAEEGYPASLPSALAAFYERAGRVRTIAGAEGSVTVIAAVSPPGGDFTEPVSAYTQRFVRNVWTLDRDLAYARHYPAVMWRSSFSRDAADLAAWHVAHGDPNWPDRRARLAGLLAGADRLQPIADLVGISALPGRERVILLTGQLIREAVLQQSALSPNDGYTAPPKQAAIADAVLAVHERCLELISRDVPASLLDEVDFSPLIRARDDAGPDDVDTVTEHRDQVLGALPKP